MVYIIMCMCFGNTPQIIFVLFVFVIFSQVELSFVFVLFVLLLYVPSQQLWSWPEDQSI